MDQSDISFAYFASRYSPKSIVITFANFTLGVFAVLYDPHNCGTSLLSAVERLTTALHELAYQSTVE
jgi:hypothetical protein